MSVAAVLALADGTVFHGESVGATGSAAGEVVFNTAMTGYQEILSDPSYCRQLVTLTCPHIGNTGINPEDFESGQVQAAGLIVRDVPRRLSSWRSEQSLGELLMTQGICAIAGLDTRRLTRLIREKGAQGGCIMAGEIDVDAAIAQATGFPGLAGMDLARVVTTPEPYEWHEGIWQHPQDVGAPAVGIQSRGADKQSGAHHVVAYDFGIKRNILRLLVEQGCRVTVVPAQTSAADALALRPDGIFLSNGPGDPEPCDYAIAAIRHFLDRDIPVFGICLGYQLLALAAGARTVKMKFGHHGANHPVADLASGRVAITSQNHGFAVDEDSLPQAVVATHRSLFDHSLQGIEVSGGNAFGFQGHPEASPGPHDLRLMFERFTQQMSMPRLVANQK